MNATKNPVFTIGHSTHSVEAFLALLRQYDVAAVADVRSAPHSRYNPQFNQDAIKRSLTTSGIKYVYLGRELGGRSEDPACYENGRIQYALMARTELFLKGIERVVRGANDYRLALMCAEKEPLECHRTLLVARALAERGIDVQHILADGSLESHEAAMDRLLDVIGLPHEDLFRTRDEMVAEALARQERRVAYVDDRATDHTAGETS